MKYGCTVRACRQRCDFPAFGLVVLVIIIAVFEWLGLSNSSVVLSANNGERYSKAERGGKLRLETRLLAILSGTSVGVLHVSLFAARFLRIGLRLRPRTCARQ